MTEKNKQKNDVFIAESDARIGSGKIACFIGIIVNAILFAFKLFVGIFSNSQAITADSINSLSDSASGVMNLLGFHISGKPADRDHPFGHGRVEYIVALIISGLIVVVGVEFLKTSVERIISPEPIKYEFFMLIILTGSIFVKVGLFFYYRMLSKKINSKSFSAAASDSISDVAITSVTLIALIVSKMFGWMIDGYVGAVISVLVIYAGISVAKEAISPLLGVEVSPETMMKITQIILSDPNILGAHDVIVHDYGPGRLMASAHAELNSNMPLPEAHRIIDILEKKIMTELNIPMTIHPDPVEVDDELTQEIRIYSEKMLNKLSSNLKLHDFRVSKSSDTTLIEFDLTVDQDYKKSDEEIKQYLYSDLAGYIAGPCRLTVHFDRDYFSACKTIES